MVGLGRIAGGGSDALILFGDQVVDPGRLVGGVTPQLGPDFLVQPLGEGLGQAVGERRGQDRRIVVAGVLEPFGDFQLTMTGGDGEGADIVLALSAKYCD